MKILVADPISERGVEMLRRNPSFPANVNTGVKEDQLCQIIDEYDALIIRSQTKVTKRVLEAARKLRAVGRAGVSLDLIIIYFAAMLLKQFEELIDKIHKIAVYHAG